jgi:hypothetical protein
MFQLYVIELEKQDGLKMYYFEASLFFSRSGYNTLSRIGLKKIQLVLKSLIMHYLTDHIEYQN